MENARLINETREALEQQTATAEVLQVINSSAGELAPVFDAILEKAHNLCDVAQGSLELYDGERIRAVAVRGMPDAFANMLRLGSPGSDNPATRPLIAGGRFSHIRDLAETDYAVTRSAVELAAVRTLLCVPLRRDNVLLGMIASARREVRPFSEKEIALLENFAAQAVVAMENARLLTEQREALEQQTATAEVLQVINASPGNLTPVFDAILEKAHSLCGATKGAFIIADGEHFPVAATRGLSDAYTAVLRHHSHRQARAGYMLDEPSPREQLLNGADLVQLTGPAVAFGPIGRAAVEIEKIRTVLFVPLRREGTLLGYITAYRGEESLFSEKQIAVLQSFAAQAVIAMENARLITEQREALEQQTATADVLQVINASPGNLAPVFDAILEKAHSLCDIAQGSLELYDGERFRAVAVRGLSDAFADMLRLGYPASDNPATRPLIEGGRFSQIRDLAETDYSITQSSVELAAARTLLCVPLRRDDTLLGMIASARREVRPFSEKEIALLENFAAQAVIAMENARLLDEIRQRQEELRITFENMGDGVAMFDETQHLAAWNRKFQDILDVPDDIIARRQTFSEYVRYLADRGEYGVGPDVEEQVRRLTGQVSQYRAYERTRPDGRIIEIRHNPVPSGGFVMIYADITERKRNEAEIRAARDAAEEASRTIEAAFPRIEGRPGKSDPDGENGIFGPTHRRYRTRDQ
jgi:two-component system, NtrC family, sensor kinase